MICQKTGRGQQWSRSEVDWTQSVIHCPVGRFTEDNISYARLLLSITKETIHRHKYNYYKSAQYQYIHLTKTHGAMLIAFHPLIIPTITLLLSLSLSPSLRCG